MTTQPPPKPEKRGRGQPTKYKPEYCELLIEHMAKGLSFETFGASIGVDRDTVFEWAKVQPDFSDAKKRAFDRCQLFWEGIGVEGIWNQPNGKVLNTGNYVFQMKNRFKWTDRVELSGSSDPEAKPILIGYNPKELMKK